MMKTGKALFAYICIMCIITTGCDYRDDLILVKNKDLNHYKTKKYEEFDWSTSKIVEIGFYPKFENGGVVENEQYIFCSYKGNHVMRIEKKQIELRLYGM